MPRLSTISGDTISASADENAPSFARETTPHDDDDVSANARVDNDEEGYGGISIDAKTVDDIRESSILGFEP